MKHVLFITSTNLASNPRCRKEVELALSCGYKVSVIAFKMTNWTAEKEQLIQEQLKDVNFHYLPADRSSYRLWLESVMLEKTCRLLHRIGVRTSRTLGIGVNRRAVLISKLLRNKKIKADFIVAHNPGAFWPAVCLAKKNIPVGIDVEDYHPGEVGDPRLGQMHALLLQKTLTYASYVSYASLPIMEQVKSLIASPNGKAHMVIHNLFDRNDFPMPAAQSGNGPLKILWFSQNIDATRGLEQILPILDEFAGKINLTLIGNPNTEFCNQYITHRPYVTIIKSMEQGALHRTIGDYDIGLAIEPGKDLNNMLALSNKMCAYFQAGLYIIATSTTGQESFISSYPEHGLLIGLKMENLKASMESLLSNVTGIRDGRRKRWENAQGVSWGNENEKLYSEWCKM